MTLFVNSVAIYRAQRAFGKIRFWKLKKLGSPLTMDTELVEVLKFLKTT